VGTQEVSDTTFGLFIAYVLPGLTVLYGSTLLGSGLGGWASLGDTPEPSVGQLLLILVQALAVGLTVSTVRWLVLDTLHHKTGVQPTNWDFAALEDGVAAFELLIHIHYRYYKFHANMVTALVLSYAAGGYALGWRGIAYGGLIVLFFLGSRDSLRKYYTRSSQLLSAS
jgi:hypothetical protein